MRVALLTAAASFFLLCVAQACNAVSYYDNNWPTMGSSTQSKPWLQDRYTKKDYKSAKRRMSGPSTTTCRCKFFIWNVISYIKYKEATYQVKENTIEGIGGKRFVRVKPNSLLERWLPQLRANQLKTDGCILCGHSYREHLEYWWWCKKQATGGVSNFESFIDKGRSNYDKQHSSFYNKYVDVLDAGKQRKRRHNKQVEVRESLEGNVAYTVPPFDPLADETPKRMWSVLLLALARTAALVRLEDLIWLDRIEYLKAERS